MDWSKIALAFLPPCAPNPNPAESLWAWLKRHALANNCPASMAERSVTARGKLESAQRRATLAATFWRQAKLF
ncbi:MAG: hypothetical protein EFKGCFLK_00574 [Rhodocyclaceae bacterium]|nr:MAG: hypothetical protein F9K21_10055 [Rhodocyclaceae bacterium]MBV6407024.1 hypothetical protein [Rhodocyclaceae bacterium]